MRVSLSRLSASKLTKVLFLASSALTAPIAVSQAAMAQDASNVAQPAADAPAVPDSEIIVTAQKRSESLQNVPISIQALSTRKLDQLNITSFNGYAQQLPSVTFQALGGTPGTNVVYMRGVASGGDGNHSGSLPSVGVYLDEQPVTTIGGNLDVHIYDIARIESLSGPQGTLYGASSEAGTIRIITNKPNTTKFEGRIDTEINTVHKGGVGGKVEGMINVPISEIAALRIVGFYQRDAGFIDNVPGCRSFIPEATSQACTAKAGGIVVNNAPFVKKNYNDTETAGGRAALKVDLSSSWTATPSVIYQDTRSHGSYGYDPKVGDLQVQHFYPEYRRDRFIQAALTIEGKIANWDLTYAGAYLDRKDFQSSDYTDYAEAYDSLYSSVGGLAGYFYYQDKNGKTIDPRQNVVGSDHFKKMSQELRIASPASARLRLVAGLFFQRQSNDIHQDYQIPGLAPLLSVNGMPGTIWLTQQHRVDKDYAAFGELSYDILPKVTLTAGGRVFKYDNSLIGFFGFGRNPAFVQGAVGNPPPNAAGSSRTGVAQCFTTTGVRLRDAQLAGQANTTLLPAAVAGSPCTDLGVYSNGTVNPVKATGDGATYRFNATWKPSRDLLLYGTVSRGFRPGGINRRAGVTPYQPDYLINYELGFKATLADGLLRINGAIYQQDWQKFQFSFLGANSFTEIHNGPNARIRGFEIDSTLNTGPFTMNVAAAYTDAKTRQNLCLFDDATFTCAAVGGNGNMVSAPKGTRLPITPQFKASGTARYTVPMGSAKVYGQFNATYQSSASSDIRTAIYEVFSGNVINPAAQLGRLPAFGQINLAIGSEWDRLSLEAFVQNVADERGQLSRFQECGSCGQRPYIVSTSPRTFGIRAGAKF
ncbi:TonB-dependent receptor [Novosphingobium sp.]|uniref:TonB-dependent receptor n=1 Tax=Novosphingobium sp. TaxID=1874826 RepID=UPI0025D2083D|nr:TonB-dependent receptor [Novosphingobium sp.]